MCSTQALDWGTVGQRRASKEPPATGRLEHLPHLACRRRLREPGALYRLGRSGDTAWFGWPNSTLVQEKIAAWYAAPDLAAEKTRSPN